MTDPLADNGPKTFREVQRFTQWYLWVILIALNGGIATTVFFYWFEGQRHEKNEAEVLLLFSVAVIMVLLTLFILAVRLETRIDRHGLYYRMYPIHRQFKRISPSEEVRVSVRTYKPILEYGGWGLRGWGNNKALNVSGNQGIQITWKDGKKLLIGTRRPEEAAKYLSRYGFNSENTPNKAQ